MRIARQNAVHDEARFRERAMQQRENQTAMDFLSKLPKGPAKDEFATLLTKRMNAMLGASNEAPAAPAPAPAEENVVVISDGEDENSDAPA